MKRNKFSLSHFRLMSCSMGQLVPLTWFEVIPGDTIQQSSSLLVRAAPLVTPPMHPVHIRVHHFFIPNRIIWQGTNPSGSSATGGFENYITGGPDGLDATVHPYIQKTANWDVGNTLADYLGLPIGTIPVTTNINALPFRAYQLIWNEYFRDQDLQTAAALSTGDGADSTTSQSVQNVCWQKDYYTTARPWSQKGPFIGILPSNAQFPVKGIGIVDGTTASSNTWRDTTNTNASLPSVQTTTAGVFVGTTAGGATSSSNTIGVYAVPGAAPGTPYTTANSINDLRRQFALMRFQEARAKYGSRYVEYLRYLGVRSSDSRLQRPEYLGGGTSTIQFSEVLQTGVTTSGSQTGVGTMFGHGISAQRTNRYRRFFEEHGIVMTVMSCRPITVYTNPLKRAWLRGMTAAGGATAPAGLLGTREDYFVRELQHIGQMQINAAEVDGHQNSVANTFGFQDRYDDYRRIESQCSGQFRGAGALNTWHFGRAFSGAATLNSTFVSSVPSVLPFADQAHDTLYIMANHSIQARRMISREGSGFVR